VSKDGQQQVKLHNKKEFACAMRLHNDGTMHFEGTASAGILKMSKLMSINPNKGHVTFEKFAEIGMKGKSGALPLRVKGGSKTRKASIAFGHIAGSVGLLGSTGSYAFLGTRDEKKFVAIQHSDGHVGLGTTTAAEDLTVKTSNPDSHLYFTSDKAPGKIAKFTMLAGGSMRLSADGGSIKSGKFEVKEFRGLAFTNAGGKAKTIFDRGGKPAGLKKGVEFKAPLVEFRSGNVGIGVKTAQKMLHVGGSHWSQGAMIVKGGFTQIKKSMMEFTSFLQTGEGDSDGTDVGALVKHLAGLVRKNKQRLHKQASSIAFMEREVSALRAR
jgi:hypothetical protein